MKQMLSFEEKITKSNLKDIEKFVDTVFSKVGIDIEFTKHFLARLNDPRNGKEITSKELISLFKKTYKIYGKEISHFNPESQAVLKDLQTNLNLPFILKWDSKNKEFDLVAKTIMRKKNFRTSNRILRV